MAGARLGYAIANSAVIEDLEKIKFSTNPYNINRLTLVAGVAALAEDKYYMDNCKKIIATREDTQKKLRELGFTMTDSKANFIFAKSDRIGGQELYEKLKDRGILVRHFSKEKIKDYNRITVGTPEEMDALIAEITDILKEKK
jgi:histidinol-phosphate aminotransferase